MIRETEVDGLGGYPEWGLHQLTAKYVRGLGAEQVHPGQRGAVDPRRREVPSGLRLTLPVGERHTPPSADTVLRARPARLTVGANDAESAGPRRVRRPAPAR